MSREGLPNQQRGSFGPRDYGATSSSTATDSNFGGFSPTEFISLSETIATNMVAIKKSWQFLEKANKTIGTPKDNQTDRDKVHAVQVTTNQKVASTTKDLQRLTVVVRRGDKQQQLQVGKFMSDFKYIIESYTKSQQVIAAKMKQVLLVTASQQDDINQDGSAQEQLSFLDQKQKMLQTDLKIEQDMLLDREQRVRQIEANVLDVNEIMKELSSMTNQQSETIDTIENTIENAVGNVESGTSELAKAAEYQAKYRRKVLILLAIAVIIGVIITGIIVSKLKS